MIVAAVCVVSGSVFGQDMAENPVNLRIETKVKTVEVTTKIVKTGEWPDTRIVFGGVEYDKSAELSHMKHAIKSDFDVTMISKGRSSVSTQTILVKGRKSLHRNLGYGVSQDLFYIFDGKHIWPVSEEVFNALQLNKDGSAKEYETLVFSDAHQGSGIVSVTTSPNAPPSNWSGYEDEKERYWQWRNPHFKARPAIATSLN